MHELTIIGNIIDIAEENAKQHNMSSISEIELDIGALSGVEVEALRFAYEVSTENTILENAKLIIHELEGVVSCNHCKTEFTTNTIFDPCPHCGKFGNTILKGQEMFVKTLRSGD